MDRKKFIRCRRCNAIHHVTPFDKAPLYSYCGGEVLEGPADDWRAFMAQHAGHTLEPLLATGHTYFATGAPTDPMAEGYIEVTDGRERFLLRRMRRSITEPLQFELAPGQLVDTGYSLEIQENAIRKEMKYHFSWSPAQAPDESKIDLFVRLLREVVGAMDPGAVTPSDYVDIDENLTYALLDNAVVEKLLAKCTVYFSSDELASIRRFVESHHTGADVMTVRLRRHVGLTLPDI